jgi:hypothetical protein
MVQQREMMGGAHVVAVLGLEWDAPGAAPSGGAGHKHENVAEEAPQGMARAAGDRAETKKCVAPGRSGTSLHAAARSALGSRPRESSSTSDP